MSKIINKCVPMVWFAEWGWVELIRSLIIYLVLIGWSVRICNSWIVVIILRSWLCAYVYWVVLLQVVLFNHLYGINIPRHKKHAPASHAMHDSVRCCNWYLCNWRPLLLPFPFHLYLSLCFSSIRATRRSEVRRYESSFCYIHSNTVFVLENERRRTKNATIPNPSATAGGPNCS